MQYQLPHNSKGFTLIELLVVIAIIGILSSVVLASLNTARARARDAKRISELKSLQIALEVYYESNGEYPDALQTLVDDSYMTALPVDPTNVAPQVYSYASVSNDGDATTCETYYLTVELEGDNMVLDSDSDAATLEVGEVDCDDGAAPAADNDFVDGEDGAADAEPYVFQLQPY